MIKKYKNYNTINIINDHYNLKTTILLCPKFLNHF